MDLSKRVGTQAARFKFGRDYAIPVFWVVMAVSTMSEYLGLPKQLFLPLVLVGCVFIWIVGFIIQTTNILKSDLKTSFSQSIEGSLYVWGGSEEEEQIGIVHVIAPIIQESTKKGVIQAVKQLKKDGII